MQYKKDRFILIVYLLGFLVLALSMALFQPLANTPPLYGNPPDEHARYLIPKYICEHGVIPTGLEEEVRIPAYGFSYALYNAFPYIIQGYVMRFVSLFTQSRVGLLYAARMVNVLFGLWMAVMVYLISRRVFSDRRFQWLFCFAVMYLPECVFMHTYVNTDSCCLLSTSMMVYALVCCYQEGINRKNSLWMSGGIILCALSYYNAYGYIVSCMVLFVAYFLQKRDGHWFYDWKKMLKWGCFISAVVLLGIGWWFIRSYIVLDGDILGFKTRNEMAIKYAVEDVNPLTMETYQQKGYTILQMIQERNSIENAFYSFVGVLGSVSIVGGAWFYRVYKMFFAAGSLGCFYYLANRRERSRMSWRRICFHVNMLYCIFMPLYLMLYYAYTTDYQHQGRYLLPALIPLMYYMVRGIEALAGIHWKAKYFPKWLVNAGICFCYLIFMIGTIYLVYGRAMPVYFETGMVLE